MGELNKYLNPETPTVQAIYDWHKQQGDAEPQRGYLGASIIGHECDRFLWYVFRACVKRDFTGRLYRLFETGDLEEIRFVKELRAIGCTVHGVDPATGQQFEVTALGGHFSGHMDGCVQGIPEAPITWHVIEMKSHKASLFAKLKKDGVKKAFPTHYAQMQSYMRLTGMKRAFYLAVCKDTDELYSERIRYDATESKNLIDRAERIIRTNKPPERSSSRRDAFKCKFCDAHALCWGDIKESALPIPCRNCETCCHATPELDGVYEDTSGAIWTCSKQNRELSIAERPEGCDGHLLLPGLIWFAEPVDAGDDWIEFENHDDKARWRHGYGPGKWSTAELIRSPGAAVGDKGVEATKLAFGGECEKTPLWHQYSGGERLWDGEEGGLGEAMDKLGLRSMKPTRSEDYADHAAAEYKSDDGENDCCVVIYKKDQWAAIWKGKM